MKILLCALLLSLPSWGASHYVLASATGTGTGADWTNACPDLTESCSPASMTRGDTYYIGAGTYAGAYTFSAAASGATYIYIKKATAADHGTDTGWSAGYGSSVATFTGSASVTTAYWDINGAVGGGPGQWTSGHGFVFTSAAETAVGYITIGDVSNVNIRRVAFVQVGDTTAYGTGANAIVNVGTLENSTLEYNYVNNIGGLPFFLRGGSGLIIQYNYTGDICGISVFNVNNHCEALVEWTLSDSHFRWNVITESPSSGGFVKNAAGTSSNIKIYGNVFQNGNSIVCNTGACSGWYIINNTFAADAIGPTGGDGTVTGAYFVNNLIYDTNGAVPWGTRSYNYWSASTISCNMQVVASENLTANFPSDCDAAPETANPFTSLTPATGLRLVSSISGTNACDIDACTGETQYDVDAFGTERGASWDIGAYEYQAEAPATRSAPFQGRVSVTGRVRVQ